MTISPELLAAYADGELDTDTARAVEAAIAGSAELQAELGAHRALRRRLAAHFAPIAEQPVPDRLRQAVFADAEPNVIDFAAAARNRRKPASPGGWTRIVGPALAASLVLALVGVRMWPAGDYARGDLEEALDAQLVASQKADGPVRVLLSFRDRQGQFCRGFTGRARSGIACRDDRGWRLLKTFGGTKNDAAEYHQAGSPDMAVMAAIQDMAAGPALDGTEEAKAARLGWQARPRH
ncbi:MAG: anti-sigma factor [Sphingomonadales bacterium]|nr:anti-sigma factor [Sphingomonadales bacterium]